MLCLFDLLIHVVDINTFMSQSTAMVMPGYGNFTHFNVVHLRLSYYFFLHYIPRNLNNICEEAGYITGSPPLLACDAARLSRWATQWTWTILSLSYFSLTPIPFLQPVITAAPSVPSPINLPKLLFSIILFHTESHRQQF